MNRETYCITGSRIGRPEPWWTKSYMGWGAIGIRQPLRGIRQPLRVPKGDDSRSHLHDVEGEQLTAIDIEGDPRNRLGLTRKAISSRIARTKRAGRPVTWELLQRSANDRG